jgi:hypothetical protein
MMILKRQKNLSAKTSNLHLYLDMFFRNMEVSQSESSEFSSVCKEACICVWRFPQLMLHAYIRGKLTFVLWCGELYVERIGMCMSLGLLDNNIRVIKFIKLL